MTTSINKWKIYCTTEGTWSFGFLDSSNTNGPTTCFNNSGHTVNNNSISIVSNISTNSVKIVEESIPTGGNYMSEGYSMNLPANTTTTKTISWPIPISVLSASYSTLTTHIGDIINFVSDSFIIGVITANITAGNTVISLNSTAINAVVLGYELIVTDGTNTDFLDTICCINKNTSTVTIRQAATHSFVAGSVIKMQRRFLKNLGIGMSTLYQPGQGK